MTNEETPSIYAELIGVVEGSYTGYRVAVRREVGHWEDGGECDCCPAGVTVEVGPYLGDAALPADVGAARWAESRGIEYRG